MTWQRIAKAKTVAIDTECTGLNPYKGHAPYSVAFFTDEGYSYYIEWEVDPFTRIVTPRNRDLVRIRSVLENRRVRKVFHNARFDMRMLLVNFGIDTKGSVHDTQNMLRTVDSRLPTLQLKPCAKRFLGISTDDEEELHSAAVTARRIAKKHGWKLGYVTKIDVFKGTKREQSVEMDNWMPATVVRLHPKEARSDSWKKLNRTYNVMDVERTMGLYQLLRPVIENDKYYKRTYRRECKLFPVLYAMENRGIAISKKQIEFEMEDTRKRVFSNLKRLKKAAWSKFNPSSNQHLARFLYKKLKLPIRKRTPTGLPKTDMPTIVEFRDNPSVVDLLNYKKSVQGFNGFFGNYKMLMAKDTIDPNGYCLHPNFQQAGTVTGRLSCRDPNMQNVPNVAAKIMWEPVIARKPFGPRPGYAWVMSDYKGQEVRIFAFVSGEPKMLEALAAGIEIHDMITNRIFGGEHNPLMLTENIRALELDGSGTGRNDKVQAIWKEFHITNPRKMSLRDKERVVLAWMKQYDYKPIDAQNSIGKKLSKLRTKVGVFGLIYGAGVDTTALLMQGNKELAANFAHSFKTEYPQASDFMKQSVIKAKRDGYVITAYGRKLRVDRDLAYQGCNYIIQGTGADQVKERLPKMQAILQEADDKSSIVNTVHDDIISEIWHTTLTMNLLNRYLKCMACTKGSTLGHPLPVDCSITFTNWADTKKIKGIEGIHDGYRLR